MSDMDVIIYPRPSPDTANLSWYDLRNISEQDVNHAIQDKKTGVPYSDMVWLELEHG